jgi:hypothetical protein
MLRDLHAEGFTCYRATKVSDHVPITRLDLCGPGTEAHKSVDTTCVRAFTI